MGESKWLSLCSVLDFTTSLHLLPNPGIRKTFLSGLTNVHIIYVAFYQNSGLRLIYVILLSRTVYLTKSHSEPVITLPVCCFNRWATSGVVPCYLWRHPALLLIHPDSSPVVTKLLLINFGYLL